MKWILRFLVLFAVAAAIAWIVGMTLPEAHTASRSVRFAAGPERVRETILDVTAYPQWRRGIDSVAPIEGSPGSLAWREIGAGDRVAYEADTTSQSRIVSRITTKGLPYGGSWEYAIEPDNGATRLTITEHGEVYNALFRFMSRYVMGHGSTIETYIRDLGGRLGEEAQIEPGR